MTQNHKVGSSTPRTNALEDQAIFAGYYSTLKVTLAVRSEDVKKIETDLREARELLQLARDVIGSEGNAPFYPNTLHSIDAFERRMKEKDK